MKSKPALLLDLGGFKEFIDLKGIYKTPRHSQTSLFGDGFLAEMSSWDDFGLPLVNCLVSDIWRRMKHYYNWHATPFMNEWSVHFIRKTGC
jgi:hypothetical protein